MHITRQDVLDALSGGTAFAVDRRTNTEVELVGVTSDYILARYHGGCCELIAPKHLWLLDRVAA